MKRFDSGRNILDDDAIVAAVEKYVDEYLYDYAVMIDGTWGCGKTYFVLKTLKTKLKEHEEEKEKSIKGYKKRNIIYISLYGVKSTEDISKKICVEVYLGKTDKFGKVLKKGADMVSSLVPVALEVAKPFTGIAELKPDDIGGVIESFLPINNSILIFDDLERCDCSINEILGYINSFVEHEKMKVIIVANQEEIGKNVTEKGRELQYLVAAGGRDIEFEPKKEKDVILQYYRSKNESSKEEKQKEPIHVEQLTERVDKLFGKNLAYEKIREKLIGITLYYYPDLEKVMQTLIHDSSINIDLKTLLRNNVDFFVKYMNELNHPNLRTFQFFLSKIENLYGVINEIRNQAQNAFFNYILEYCFKICVNYKSGNLLYLWESKQEYGSVKFSKLDIFGSSLAFRFVDDFVIDSILDSKRVERMIKIYETEFFLSKSEYDMPFRKLEYLWHILEDGEVEKYLEETLDGLSKNEYKVSEYARIIPLMLRLEKVGFSSAYLERAVNYMKANLKLLERCVAIDDLYHPGEDKSINQQTKEILNELNQFIQESCKENAKDTIGEIIGGGNGWANRLLDYVEKNKQDIHRSSGFLVQLDIDCLTVKVQESTAKDIYDFRSCLFRVYDNQFMHGVLDEEREEVGNLLQGIKGIRRDDYDRIKCMQLDWLTDALKKILSEYMKPQEKSIGDI